MRYEVRSRKIGNAVIAETDSLADAGKIARIVGMAYIWDNATRYEVPEWVQQGDQKEWLW